MMLEWITSSCFLILVVLALRATLGRKLSARFRYALWALVLVRLLVPVQLFTSPVAGMTVNVSERVGEQMQEKSIYVLPIGRIPVEESQGYIISEDGQVSSANSFGYEKLEDNGETIVRYADKISPLQALKALWFTGGAVLALVLLVSNLHFSVCLRRVRKPLEGIECRIPVYMAEGLPSPCLFGVLQPAVYVTAAAAEDPDMLRHVLAHELTHYRHLDHIWSVLRGLALAVHWWNPLAWLAAVLSRRDGELACDEGALNRLGREERVAYGETLLALVTAKPSLRDLLSCATTMSGEKRSLRERIRRIACEPKQLVSAVVVVIIVVSLTAVCAFGRAAVTDEITADANEVPSIALDQFLENLSAEDIGDISERAKISGIRITAQELVKLLQEAVSNRMSGFYDYTSYVEQKVWSWSAAGWTVPLADGSTLHLDVTTPSDKDNIYHDSVYIVWETEDSALSAFYCSEELHELVYNMRSPYSGTLLPGTPDLDHDGEPEKLYAVTGEDGNACSLVCMGEGEDGEFWYENAYVSHVGWNALFLCHIDGQDYLLRYNPYMSGGVCDYSYKLFYLDRGREVTVQENSVGFDIIFNPDYADQHEFAPKAIASFMDEINALLTAEDTVQLLNTDENLLNTFEKEGRLYDSLWWLEDDRDEELTLLENLLEFQNRAIEEAAVPDMREVAANITVNDILFFVSSVGNPVSQEEVMEMLKIISEKVTVDLEDREDTGNRRRMIIGYKREDPQTNQIGLEADEVQWNEIQLQADENTDNVYLTFKGTVVVPVYSENPDDDAVYLRDVPYSISGIVSDADLCQLVAAHR